MIAGIGGILEIGSKIIDKLFPDKQAADAAKIKLLELQQAGEFKQIDADLEQQRIEAGDRDSARKREGEVKDNTNKILAYIITLGFFALIFMISSKYLDLTGDDKDLLYILIGALSAKFSDVFTYYFGSSSNSRNKDNLIASLKKNNN